MQDDEIIKKFTRFTHPEKDARLGKVAFSEGQVYATDGRIGCVCKLNDPHTDEIPENYPIKSLKGILDGPRAVTRWFSIKFSEFEILDETFKTAYRSELGEYNQSWHTRYIEEECPCCEETVYFDSWNGELVRMKEKNPGLDLREVEKSTLILFANGESVLINFGYLHMIMRSFGESVMFAIGHCTDEKNPMLYMKTIDNRFYGVLMPMRSYDGDYKASYVLQTWEPA